MKASTVGKVMHRSLLFILVWIEQSHVRVVYGSYPCLELRAVRIARMNQADDAPHASEVMERYHIANLNIMIQQDVSANGWYAVLFALLGQRVCQDIGVQEALRAV